jgi:hypothetical protein
MSYTSIFIIIAFIASIYYVHCAFVLLETSALSGYGTVKTNDPLPVTLQFNMYINKEEQLISVQYSLTNNSISKYVAPYTANILDFANEDAYMIMLYDDKLTCFQVQPETNVFEQDAFKYAKIEGYRIIDNRLTLEIKNVTMMVTVPNINTFSLYLNAFTQHPVRLENDDFVLHVTSYERIKSPPEYFQLPQGIFCN